MLNFSSFMCFIEKETQNFILKFREIFLWRETVLRAHGMKSDEKPFSIKFMQFFEGKWYMLWLTGIFLYFWKVWRFVLMAHSWQKWKRVFLTCPCHKIYRDEAVGLKSCKNTWKITIFVKMWILGQYRENLIFCP